LNYLHLLDFYLLKKIRYAKDDRSTSYGKDIENVKQDWETKKKKGISKIERTKSTMALLDVLRAKEMQINKAHLQEKVSVRDMWKLREELACVRKMIEIELGKTISSC